MRFVSEGRICPRMHLPHLLPDAKAMRIYLFGVLRCFQHCTGHITMGSWKGRGNQYIQFIRVLYCKLPTNGKQLPAFPLEAVPGTEPRPQRWEARVLPLCHCGPQSHEEDSLKSQKLKTASFRGSKGTLVNARRTKDISQVGIPLFAIGLSL